jgi:acyl dehydratase
MSVETSDPTIQLDTAPRLYEGVVDAQAAAAYAKATFDPLPDYLEGRAVPPLYSAVLLLPALDETMHACIDAGALDGLSEGPVKGVHAEHDIYFHAPIHPDQRVRWDAQIRSVHQTPAGVLITQQLLVRDHEDRPLIEHLWSTMMLRCTTRALGGPPVPDHRYPDAARGHVIGIETIAIPRNQGEIYGAASGDNVGHALSDEIARSEGYASKILQGMCSFAICTGAAIRIGAEGDPIRLRRVACRFSAPVIQGDDLEIECVEVGALDDGTSVVAFEARQGDTLCISHGRAEFRDPS